MPRATKAAPNSLPSAQVFALTTAEIDTIKAICLRRAQWIADTRCAEIQAAVPAQAETMATEAISKLVAYDVTTASPDTSNKWVVFSPSIIPDNIITMAERNRIYCVYWDGSLQRHDVNSGTTMDAFGPDEFDNWEWFAYHPKLAEPDVDEVPEELIDSLLDAASAAGCAVER